MSHSCWQRGKGGQESWTPSPIFLVNLVMLVSLGVLFSGWLLRYTDHFEFFGGLLALSGLFAWLAFVSKVLPETRLKTLQNLFAVHVFDNRLTVCVVGFLLLFLSGTFLLFGSVQIRDAQNSEAAVWITAAGQSLEGSRPLHLSAGGRIRRLRYAPFWRGTSVKVKVSGLPCQTVAIGPWTRRADLNVPYSFMRPVVLVGFNKNLAKQIAGNSGDYELEVTVDQTKHPLPMEAFEGHSIWIGDAPHMSVPPHVAAKWKGDLDDATARGLLLDPRVPQEIIAVDSGDHLTLLLKNTKDNTTTGPERLLVRPVRSVEDIVQWVRLE